jgi:ATP-dependent helicase/nuclease subunit B
MSTKTGQVRYVRLSPGRRHFQRTLLKLMGKKRCQLSATSDALLRGMRSVAPEAELLPLGQLISQVYQLTELQGKLPIAFPGQVVAAIAEACQRLSPDRPLGRVGRISGIHRALAATIQDLRGYELGPSELELAVEKASEFLAPKLLDLAFVYRESEEALKLLKLGHLSDGLAATLATSPKLADELGRLIIAVDGEVTPLVTEWFTWLAKCGAEVIVLGEIHTDSEALFARPSELLNGARVETQLDESGVADLVFSLSTKPVDHLKIDIVSAADVLAECEWALRGCHERMQAGLDSDKLGIVARDLKQYGPFLVAASERLGVPIVMARREPLLSNRLAAFFSELLLALGANDVRKLLVPFRSPYVGLDRETYAMIETTIRESHRIRGSEWEALSLASESLRDHIPWLAPLLDWRSEAKSQAVEPHEWITRFFDFAEIVPWQEILIEDPTMFERDGRAVSALKGVLHEQASVAKVRGPAALPYAAAVSWMRRAWEDADYSVPAGTHGVHVVGSASELPAISDLFVLGMLEGTFPRRPREDPILSDAERDELSDLCGLKVKLPTSKLSKLGEREEFVRVCAAPTRRLTFSYPATSADRDNIPTAYLDEAHRLANQVELVQRRRTEYAPSNPELQADIALSESLAGPPAPYADPTFSLDSVREGFTIAEGTPISASDLRRASSCAFAFAAHELLDIAPDRTSAAWVRLVRLPRLVHLATQLDPESARSALKAALDEMLDASTGRLDEWELKLLAASGSRHIEEWIAREFRARELWPREVLGVDVKLGELGTSAAAGRGVPLTDRLPALSRMGPYTVAHLYETVAPEGSKLDDSGDTLYYGTLLALIKSGREASALEIDGMNGRRILLVRPNSNAGHRSDPKSGLFISSFEQEGTTSENTQRIRGLVNSAVETMRVANVRPRPGPRCERCQFGELCRQSSVFGETSDLPQVTNGSL